MAEAARRLGVHVSRVRQRIDDGSLAAEKVGHQWVIEAADVELVDRKRAGRPLSSRSAWALAWVASGQVPGAGPGSRGLDAAASPAPDPVERSRGRARLRQLLQQVEALQDAPNSVVEADGSPAGPYPRSPSSADDDPAAVVAALARLLLKNRAQRVLFRCSPRDLADLRADSRLALAGVSAPTAGIAAGDIVEAYLPAGDLDRLVEEFLLVDADRGSANVVLHVVDADQPQLAAPGDNWLLLAADLADYHRPRETVRAAQLLGEAARNLPPTAASAASSAAASDVR